MKRIKTRQIILLLAMLGSLFAACGAELNPKTEGHIVSALEAKRDAFQACYETALAKDREVKGEMALQLDINKENGKVTNTKVEKSAIADSTMKKCVCDATSDIKLAEPPGVPVEGHYALDFGFEN